MISPIEPDLGKCHRYEFLKRMGDARSNNEVVGLIALKHFPHRLDVVGSPTPIAADQEVAGSKSLSVAGADLAAAAVTLRVTKRCGRRGIRD